MSFIEHTHDWLRGEAVDMAVLSATGLALLSLAFVLWRFVTTPLGQALVIPTLLVSLLFLVVGFYGVVSTPIKIAEFSAAYDLDPLGLVQAEQTRVAGFQALYTYTLMGATIGFALATGLFLATDQAVWRAIAIALVFVGLSALVIDGFSKERAATYAAQIEEELAHQSLFK